MNIFAIDRDPKKSAQHLVDRHVVKMILESSQILSNCFTKEQLSHPDCPRTKTNEIRSHSYPNHPCCKWATKSRENMRWLISHAEELDRERMERYHNTKPHFSMDFIHWCKTNIDESIAPETHLTEFVLAMPDEYKTDDTVESYRNYYKFGKKHLHQWKRNKPEWI